MIEYITRSAVNGIFIGDGNNFHRYWLMLHNDFRYSRAKPSKETVFFYRDNASSFRNNIFNGFSVQWFQGMHIKNPGSNSMFFELDCSFEAMKNGFTCSYYGKVVAFMKGYRFSNLQRKIAGFIYIGHSAASHSYINRKWIIHQLTSEGNGLGNIAGKDNVQTRECAHNRNIVQAVMSAAQSAVANTSAHSYYFDRIL